MSDTATSQLPANPTQDQVRAAADEDGIATFRSETDMSASPIKEHRDAHAEGGEYGPKKTAAPKKTTAAKTAAPKKSTTARKR